MPTYENATEWLEANKASYPKGLEDFEQAKTDFAETKIGAKALRIDTFRKVLGIAPPPLSEWDAEVKKITDAVEALEKIKNQSGKTTKASDKKPPKDFDDPYWTAARLQKEIEDLQATIKKLTARSEKAFKACTRAMLRETGARLATEKGE